MLFLKKAWTWLKKHWYVPLLLLLVGASGILGVFGFSKNKQLEKMLEINKKSYQDQIKAIEESHEAELKRRDEVYARYISTMKKLEVEHDVDLSHLSEEKKKKLDTMVKKYKGTPDELAKELSEMFGVEHVE
jgi:transcriptional antiterminator